MNTLKRLVPCFVLSLGLVLSLQITAAGQQDQTEQSVRSNYKKAIRLLTKESPEPQRAYDLLQTAIQNAGDLPPEQRGELLMWLWNSTTNATFEAMLKDPELKHAAERIMELAKGGYWDWKMNQDRVASLVNQLVRGGYQEKLEAQHRLISAGQYAAPKLIDALKSDRIEQRAMAEVTLRKMGTTVVPPLSKALKSESDIQRVTAAAVLGDIRDVRALPALKRVMETDPSKRAKEVAAKSIEKIIQKPIPRPWEDDSEGKSNCCPQRYHHRKMGLKEAEQHHHHDHTHPELGIDDYPHTHRPEQLKPAKQLYLELGEKYFLADPDVTRKLYGDTLVWEWDEQNQKVTARRVPKFLLNESLAANVLHDGLELDPGYGPVLAQLVNSYFKMFHESEKTLQTAKNLERVGGEKKILEEKALEKLQKDLAERNQTLLPGELLGARLMYRSLSRAVEHEKPLVAVSSMNILQNIGASKELPAVDATREAGFPHAFPIVSALIRMDLRSSVKAASLLVNMEPQKKFLAWDRVIPTLAKAVNIRGLRQVVIASMNHNSRNTLANKLRNPDLHSQTHLASTPEELLEKAKEFPDKDLILMTGEMAGKLNYSFEVPGQEPHQQRVLDALKKDLRTESTPIVLVGENEEREAELRQVYGDAVHGYVSFPINPEDFEDLFRDIQKQDFALKAREEAEDLALQGARALADVNPRGPVFDNYNQAVPALAGTLENRPNDLRIAACKALGKFANLDAVPDLTSTLNDPDNPNELREVAGKALAKIFEKNNNYKPDPEAIDVLVENMQGTPFVVQQAASQALGSSGISSERKRELIERHKRETDKLGEPALD